MSTIQEQAREEAMKLIVEAINRKILTFSENGIQENAVLMEHWERERNPQKRFQKMELVSAIPIESYHWLNTQNPDGEKRFDHNADYMKWLSNQEGFAYLKDQPLALKDRRELWPKRGEKK